MRRHILLFASLALFAAGCDSPMMDEVVTPELAAKGGAAGATARYEVTITNLTDGQALTPPVVATHRPATHIFRVGRPASAGVQQVAENGNLDPLVAALMANRHVAGLEVAVAGDPPPLLPGQSVTIEIDGGPGARWLSFVSMLICTNDGFTGVDSYPLPREVGDEVTFSANSYDAGTEVNTEDFADIVPPCQPLSGVSSEDEGTGMSNPDLHEGGVITRHGGVSGGDDLTEEAHGWDDPTAQVTIKRIG